MSSSLPLQVGSCKMEVRVAAVVLLMVAMCAAHGERYVVKKMVKAAPQYQPYSVKSQGKRAPLPALCLHSLSALPVAKFLPPPEQQLQEL